MYIEKLAQELLAEMKARLTGLLVVFGLAPVLAGCGSDFLSLVHHVHWTEPVELPGGDVEVSRESTFSVSRAFGEKTGMLIQTSSRLSISAGETAIPAIDVGPLFPMLLRQDESTREWILVAGTNDCNTWLRNGEPKPACWGFRLHDSEWFRADIPQALMGLKPNLLVDIRTDDRGKLGRREVERRKTSQSNDQSIPNALREVMAYDPLKKNCGHATGSIGEMDLKQFRKL